MAYMKKIVPIWIFNIYQLQSYNNLYLFIIFITLVFNIIAALIITVSISVGCRYLYYIIKVVFIIVIQSSHDIS